MEYTGIISHDVYKTQLESLVEEIQTNKEKNVEKYYPPVYFTLDWKTIMDEKLYKDKDYTGELLFLIIMNSIKNRKLNLANDDVLADKLAYAIGIIYFIRKYNQLPTSIITDLDGYTCQLAKDRGHTTYVLVNKHNEKYGVKVWEKVLTCIEEDPHNYDGVKAIENIRNKIDNGEEQFSLEDIIPRDIWTNFRNSSISIEVSPETMGNHIGEIDGLNNLSNGWTDHQNGMNAPEQLLIYNPDSYEENYVDEIYNYVSAEDLFQGNLTPMGSIDSKKKPCGYEEETIWLYQGTKSLNDDLVDRIKGLHHRTVKSRKKSYNSALEKSKIQDFKDSADFMKWVSESDKINDFEEALSEVMDSKKKSSNTKNVPGQLKGLSTKKTDAFMSACLSLEDVIKRAYKGRRSESRVTYAADKFFINATKLIQNKVKVTNLLNTDMFSTGLEGRYLGFWKECQELTVKDCEKNSGDKSKDELLKLYGKEYSAQGYSTMKPIEIFSRKSSNKFVKVSINFTDGKNLEEGHKKPELHSTFLQPKADNVLLGGASVHDIDAYADDYDSDLDKVKPIGSLSMEEQKIVINTKMLTQCWRKIK